MIIAMVTVCKCVTVCMCIAVLFRTEANDLALFIAETVTGHSEIIVIDG